MAQGMDRQINPKECNKSVILSLLMLMPFAFGYFGKEVKASPPSTCRVVARVAYAPNPADLLKPLCAGQIISLPANTKAVCLANLNIITVRTTKDLDLCDVANKNPFESCDSSNPDRKSLCEGVGRSSLDAKRPLLESPYGVVLLPQPLLLRWQAVEGADSYRIVVDGDRNQSKVITPNTTLQLTLKDGTVSIITQAMRSGQVISSSVKTFDVLSEQISKSLSSDLKKVDNSKAPDDDKSFVKVAILNHFELLNDSKEYLEKQVKLSKSALLSLTLAELYFKLGLYAESKNQYKYTISLAEDSNDVNELHRAREGYRIVSVMLEESLEPRS